MSIKIVDYGEPWYIYETNICCVWREVTLIRFPGQTIPDKFCRNLWISYKNYILLQRNTRWKRVMTNCWENWSRPLIKLWNPNSFVVSVIKGVPTMEELEVFIVLTLVSNKLMSYMWNYNITSWINVLNETGSKQKSVEHASNNWNQWLKDQVEWSTEWPSGRLIRCKLFSILVNLVFSLLTAYKLYKTNT